MKWPLLLIALSIILGLIGSLNIGHAILSNNGSSLTHAPAASPTQSVTHTPAPKKPRATTTSSSKPTPKATVTPGNTPAPVANTPIPTATPAPGSPPPSSTIVLAHDDFTRSDQSFWGAASDGQQWSGDATANGAFVISGDKGVIANGNGYYNAIIGPQASNAAVVVSGTLTGFEAMDRNNYTSFGPILRWQDSNNWYKAFIDGNALSIIKHVNGQPTTLAIQAFPARPGVFYTLRFRTVGSTLQARVWRTGTQEPADWMLTATDSSLSSGQAGLRLGMQYDITAYLSSFTEFSD